MKRIRLFTVAILIGLTPATALAAVGLRATRATPSAPRELITGLVCQTALDPPARAISITAVMRPVTGTEKLSVEFQLLERAPGATVWTPVAGPGLGSWVSPTSPATLGQQPNDVWIVKKPIADLDAPASYRFEVTFRWLGSRASVLQTTTALSKVCRQPELRPDLTVNSISVTPGRARAGADVYSAVIDNLGVTGAGPFEVELGDGGQPVDSRTVQHLGGHGTVTVELRGPVCDPSQPPVVTVDPNDQVDVSSRAQATLAAQCPSASTPTSTSTTTIPTTASGTPVPPVGAADGIPVSG